jgi:hypothetical protein
MLHSRKVAKDEADIEAQRATDAYQTHVHDMKLLQRKMQSHLSKVVLGGTAARLRRSLAIGLLGARVRLQEDVIDDARALRDDKHGIAKAAGMAFDQALRLEQQLRPQSSSSSATSTAPVLERPLKRTRTAGAVIPLPTWTTGKILSNGAAYWRPECKGWVNGGWVSGYSHLADSSRSQRFVLHLDTGNSSLTCISKSTFDFLGLAETSERIGNQHISGVHGQSQSCPVYKIRFALDLANRAHPDPNHMYSRTTEAAVIDTSTSPGQVGYFDLLVNAADIRKFLDLSLPEGKRLQLKVLDGAPETLYDRQPLQLTEPFSTKPPERMRVPRSFPRFGEGDGPLFEQFFGHNRFLEPACVMAAVH